MSGEVWHASVREGAALAVQSRKYNCATKTRGALRCIRRAQDHLRRKCIRIGDVSSSFQMWLSCAEVVRTGTEGSKMHRRCCGRVINTVGLRWCFRAPDTIFFHTLSPACYALDNIVLPVLAQECSGQRTMATTPLYKTEYDDIACCFVFDNSEECAQVPLSLLFEFLSALKKKSCGTISL